jgi:hypothetical protein
MMGKIKARIEKFKWHQKNIKQEMMRIEAHTAVVRRNM